jgi:hypothetical protein
MTAGIAFVAFMAILGLASWILRCKDKREARRLAGRDRMIREARGPVPAQAGRGPAAERAPLSPRHQAAWEDLTDRIGHPGNLAGQTGTEATEESA